LLQLPVLRFLPADDARLASTVAAVRRALTHQGWIRRYDRDPIGKTETAFTLCTFWLVEALACIGDRAAARAVFEDVLRDLSPLALVSEDFDPVARRMWGNFPQAYSHVGLIRAAFAALPTWNELG
jgi:GH15 family glucan-1,4-alpha-glucosidase